MSALRQKQTFAPVQGRGHVLPQDTNHQSLPLWAVDPGNASAHRFLNTSIANNLPLFVVTGLIMWHKKRAAPMPMTKPLALCDSAD
jgi:hypothetical protein